MASNVIRQKGQVLLITVLVLSIAVTVGLSLIGRTTTDIAISRQIEESARAFNAAEAGLEEALKTRIGRADVVVAEAEGVRYTTEVRDIGGESAVLTLPKITINGQTETIWLAPLDANNLPLVNDAAAYTGNLDVCWSADKGAALEAALLVGTAGDYHVERYAFDENATRIGTNYFSAVGAPGGACGDIANAYRATITVPVGAAMLRVRPLYADARIAVSPQGGRVLPKQGVEVTATGTTLTGVSRKIVVKTQFAGPPAAFDYVVYSQGDFVRAAP